MSDGAHRRRRSLLVLGALAAIAIAALIAVLAGAGGPRRTRATGTSSAGVPGPPGNSGAQPSPVTTIGPLAQPAPAGEAYGANVNWLFNARLYSLALIEHQLHGLAAASATVARSDAPWELAEPRPPVDGVHRYYWGFDDLVAGLLAGAGLTWLPIIDYSAPWAQSTPGTDHSPPASLDAYASYAAAFAARYGRGGSFWREHPTLSAEPVNTIEIWNEPDNPVFWSPSPDASRYAQLYAGARGAIKAVDQSVRVIVGGLTHPTAFLLAMLAARPDLRGHIDGVAIHPYRAEPRAVLAGVRAARGALVSLGLGTVPLYITEFGWTTRPPGAPHYLSEELRPTYIRATLGALGHLECGIAATVVYTWVTPEEAPSDSEQWFGISPPAGGNSADVSGFAAGLRAANAPGSQLPCTG